VLRPRAQHRPVLRSRDRGQKQAEEDIRKNKIEDYSRAVLEFEYTHGRAVSKEEAFRVCGIPYAFLNDVMEFLSGKAEISLSGMAKEEFDKFERMSREVLVNTMEKRDLAAHGLRLCDITVSFPELRIASAKKILSYIQAVETHEFSTKVTDPQTEVLLRQALELPNDQKNVLGIIRNLGVGPYWAKQLSTILKTFQGEGMAAPAVALSSIVSQSYGRYTPFDEREARKGRTELEEMYEERPSRRRPPQETRRRRDEEPEEEEEEPRAQKRYSREVEAVRERIYEEPPRQKPKKEPTKQEAEASSDLIGRRCLFHGGVAVARCEKCKAVLCRECIRGSDKCPRCNHSLKDVTEDRPRQKARPEAREEPEEEPEVEEEAEEERPRKKSKEQRPPKKKAESDDLSRL
jgi:hypothetical protein